MLRGIKPGSGRSAPLIIVLTVVFLGAMAFAIPKPPIVVEPSEVEAGFLVGHSQLSDQLAEQLAREGYTYLAVDLTDASLHKKALWRAHLESVSSRRFPIWAWVDVGVDEEQAAEVLSNLNVAGLFVYGRDAGRVAAALRIARPDKRIVPVLSAPGEGDHAVAMDYDSFVAASGDGIAVLKADVLSMLKVRDARAKAQGDYVVAGIALLEP